MPETNIRNLGARRTPSPHGHSRDLSESSDLSSAPSDIGNTPIGLISPEKRARVAATNDGSPLRRSMRKRKSPDQANEGDEIKSSSPENKRQKTSDSFTASDTTDSADRKVSEQGEAVDHSFESNSPRGSQSSPTASSKGSDDVVDDLGQPIAGSKGSKPNINAKEKAIAKQHQKRMTDQLSASATHANWPEFRSSDVIMYGADATTISTPDHFFDSPSPSPAKRAARGNGRGGSRGGGNNGRGRGTGKGGRGGGAAPPGKGREESQEPPQKQITTEEDQNLMRIIRKRQAELRQFFHIVGGQQRDILDQLATRDLNKLVKKPKAHKQVPEYDELVADLERRKSDVQDLIRRDYEHKKAQAIKEMEMEKELLEMRYQRHIEQVKEEHIRGAAGDIALFKNAHAAKADDTYTQGGSEVDYFPYYHELPEADSHVRGYVSSKITDEQPFRVSLPSFDELAKRDVIEDEVTRPVIESIQKKQIEKQAEIDRENEARRIEDIRKKTQNMTALTAEAEKQLEEMKGYLIPRPFREPQEQQYALSRLADMADWMRSAHPDQHYVYMPLPPGVKFPKEALSFKRNPEEGGHAFPQPPPAAVSAQPPRTQLPPTPESAVRSIQPPPLMSESSMRSTPQLLRESSMRSIHASIPDSVMRSTQPQVMDPSMRSAQPPPSYPSDPAQVVTPIQFGPPGPHRQIAMKPTAPPTNPPQSYSAAAEQSRRSSLRSLAPQPSLLPPFPPPPQLHHHHHNHHHQQQYTFLTPQQPPQSAQFVSPSIPPTIQNLHHHRHNSSASPFIDTNPSNNLFPAVRPPTVSNRHPSTLSANTPGPMNNPRARSKSGGTLTTINASNTTGTANTNTPPTPLSLASQQSKIPMQFVNSTPESARMKALQQQQQAQQAQQQQIHQAQQQQQAQAQTQAHTHVQAQQQHPSVPTTQSGNSTRSGNPNTGANGSGNANANSNGNVNSNNANDSNGVSVGNVASSASTPTPAPAPTIGSGIANENANTNGNGNGNGNGKGRTLLPKKP